MATAAVVDAGRKDRRRRELDDKIAEARSSLAGLLEQSAGQDLAKILSSPYPDVPYSRPLERLDVLRDICKLEAGFLQDLQKKRRDRFKTAQNIREALGLPWNPELPSTRKTTLARCEEVITAEKEWDLERREPQTEIHMEKVTDMITDLVDRLMAEAWWVTELEAPGSHPALISPDSANTMIRMLRSDGYPCYTHPDLAPTSTVVQRERLNEVNVQILSDWSPPFRERYVAKICYNLLVCGVTPGIQNYNMLMLGFSFVGEHHLSQAVADSFLFLSHMRPTEATYLCLLHHFRMKGDVVGFQSIIKRMFGWDARGIGLMRRTADYVERFPELRAWATGDVAEIGGHFVQRAPFTQNVAEAILEGLIDFNMLREGAKMVAVCLREQWTVSRDLMWRLFHSCLTLLDSAAAKMVIRGLLDNIGQTSLMLLGPEAVGPALVRQLRHLLNIWQATAPPGINGVGHAGVRSDNSMGDVEEARLHHLATAIWIREMWHHSSMMVWWLRRTDRKLFDRGTPLIERLDMVISVLNFAAERPRLKMAKSMHIRRIAKVDWLMAQTLSTDFHIRQAEHTILKVANKKLPRALRKFPLVPPRLANKQRSLDKRIRGAMLYDTPGTLENNLALCFRVSSELDYRIKRLLVYALPRVYAKKLQRTQNDSGDVSLDRILAYFYHYLASARHREERALGLATRPDPFSQLLLDVPDRASFWNEDEAPGGTAAGSTTRPERPDW